MGVTTRSPFALRVAIGSPIPTLRAPRKGRAAIVCRNFWLYHSRKRQAIELGEKPELLKALSSVTARDLGAYTAHQRRENPFALARRFQATLQLPGVKTESDVGRVIGCSRARVSQMLALLRLPQEICRWVEANYEKPEVRRHFTERQLRPLSVTGDREAQLARFSDMVAAAGLSPIAIEVRSGDSL